jgi:hypothetical protein
LLRRFSAAGSLNETRERALALDARERVVREVDARDLVREVEARDLVVREGDFLAGGISDSSAGDRDVVRAQAYTSVMTTDNNWLRHARRVFRVGFPAMAKISIRASSKHRGVLAPAPMLLTACAIAVAGCGGSSSNTSTSAGVTTTAAAQQTVVTTTAAARTAPPVSPAAAASYKGKLETYAACMRRNGVNIAPPTTGPSGQPLLGAPPSNVTPLQIHAALLKCRTQIRAALLAHRNLYP